MAMYLVVIFSLFSNKFLACIPNNRKKEAKWLYFTFPLCYFSYKWTLKSYFVSGLASGLGEEIDSQNELVENIIGKTERADITLQRQNKDMTRLLK